MLVATRATFALVDFLDVSITTTQEKNHPNNLLKLLLNAFINLRSVYHVAINPIWQWGYKKNGRNKINFQFPIVRYFFNQDFSFYLDVRHVQYSMICEQGWVYYYSMWSKGLVVLVLREKGSSVPDSLYPQVVRYRYYLGWHILYLSE